MEAVLDVYKRPYNADYTVVCMDESPKQLIEEFRQSIKMKPGQDARVDVEVTKSKTKKDWAHFIKGIAEKSYPKGKKITVAMDDFKTHGPSAFYETFEPLETKQLCDRFEFVFTPKHGNWLNMAEIELHILNGQCLNRNIPPMKKIKEEVNAWPMNRNNKNS